MPDWIKRFDGVEEVTPPVSDEQLGKVPARRGVFLMLGAGDVQVVLVPAADMRARLRNRLAEPLEEKRTRRVDLREVTRKVCWKLTTSHFETDLEYFETARRIWPKTYHQLLAWKPAWFVAVNPAEKYPHFVRTCDVLSSGGKFLGPFAAGGDADRFIESLQDAFDLCRDYNCLRLSPNGPRCSYAQMGKCLSPCDGAISMDDYRKVISQAADFAAGKRDELHQRLEAEMARASEQLAFEKAGAIKTKLERLGEFDQPAYRYVRPVGDFRYFFVQPGSGRYKARAFLVNGGSISSGGQLDYPLRENQLKRLLAKMSTRARQTLSWGKLELYRMGLASQYLYYGPQRRGVVIHWPGEMKVDILVEAIENARDQLKLKTPGKHKKTKKTDKASQ